MSEYFCDLANDFSNPTNVGDAWDNPANGPGGLMAMIHGWGLHDQMSSGDTLWITGTGDLRKLVKITVDVDKSGTWSTGDIVQNYNTGGGSAGDDWVGVLCFIDGTTLWVQINSASSDIDSVSTSDGIDNPDVPDFIPGANMTDAIVRGIELNGLSGGTTSGRINYRGTTNLEVPESNRGQCVLDCNVASGPTSATYGIVSTNGMDSILLDYISVREAANDGIGIANTSSSIWVEHCLVEDCSDLGISVPGTRCSVVSCICRNNAEDNIFMGSISKCLLSIADGGGDYGINAAYVVFGCIATNNVDDNISSVADNTIVINCVGSDSDTGSGWKLGVSSTTTDVFGMGNRFTGNNQYGLEAGASAMIHLNAEDYNVYHGNLVSARRNMNKGTNSIDSASSGMDADWNVEDGADLDALAVVLNWDEA